MSSRGSLKGRSPKPATHGGIDYAELEALGLKPGEVLDFSANINPFGPPPGLREALERVDISSYPDSGSGRLRKALAEKLGLGPDSIIAGNGSTEIMRLAALAFFRPGDRVLVIEPAFGEYEVSCRIAGAEVVKHVLKAEDGFALKVSEVAKLAAECRPAGLFVTNPNNPTGKYYSREVIEEVLASPFAADSLIVLDEAYLGFVDPPGAAWSSLDLIERHNLLILRSMTKDYALAGLRLGYGVAGKEIIARLRSICPPWNVNAAAQEAGLYVLKEERYLEKSLSDIRKVKAHLVEGLKKLGFNPEPSATNFFLIETGNGALWRRELLKRKILARDCASFGLPGHIRISVRTREDCDKLLEGMKGVKGRLDGKL